MRAVLLHWPHVLPIALALATVVYLWRADRRHRAAAPRAADRRLEPQRPVASPVGAGRPRGGHENLSGRPVAREAARRGALVLAPLLGATASGAVVYGVAPGAGLIWTHTGLSILLCLLAAYKLAGTDLTAARRDWRKRRATAAAVSILLAALLVPILLTGIVLLVRPSEASFAANLHLIASAWWTLLAARHIARYAARSLRTLRTEPSKLRRRWPSARPS